MKLKLQARASELEPRLVPPLNVAIGPYEESFSRCIEFVFFFPAPPKPKSSSKNPGLSALMLKSPKEENANDLGNALRLLSDQRKKNEALLEEQAEREKEIQAALLETQKVQEEKEKLAKQMAQRKKKEKLKKKLKEREKMREALILKAKAEEQVTIGLVFLRLAACQF